jgi:hypothetical protein
MIFNGNDDHMMDDGYHMMDWWYASWFGPYWYTFGWIFMIAGWLIYFGIVLAIALYVHKDAVKRGLPNAEVWVLIVLIFSVIGLLIYLLVRDNYSSQARKETNKPIT